jgi:hypothetical protein
VPACGWVRVSTFWTSKAEFQLAYQVSQERGAGRRLFVANRLHVTNAMRLIAICNGSVLFQADVT